MTPRRPEVVTVLVDLPQFEEPALTRSLTEWDFLLGAWRQHSTHRPLEIF